MLPGLFFVDETHGCIFIAKFRIFEGSDVTAYEFPR